MKTKTRAITCFGIPVSRVLSARFFVFMVLLVFSLLFIYTYTRLIPVQTAHAATSSTLSFQARLYNSDGSIVDDGYYNIEFKLYDASSSSGSSQGSCAGDSNCLWTETLYDTNGGTAGNDYRVRVVNGYFSVYLGDTANGGTAFPGTIDWDQELWLTLNIGGSTQTASPTYDGEMSPRIKLTAVPYAFQAENALGVSSNDTSTSSTNSNNVTIKTGNATGATSNSGNLTIDTGTATQTTGTISLGATNTSAITIGSGSNTISLQTSNIDISSAGAITGATGFSMSSGNFVQSGTGTFSTGTGTVSLNGATTVDSTLAVNGNTTLGNAVGDTTDINGSFATKKGSDYSTTGTSNNVSFGDASLIRLTGASAQTITGIAGGRDGERLTLVNAGSASAIIANLSGSSSASNQITTGIGSDISLPVGNSVSLVYDSTASLWRVVGAVAGGDATCSTCANLALSNLSSVNINTALNATGSNLTLQTTTSGDIVLSGAGNIELQDNIVNTLGNLVFDDTTDIGSATTGVRVATSGSILDIDGNLILDDTVDVGSTTVGIRVSATDGSILDIDGNLILNDQVDIGSTTTGIRVTTAGAISDIDGNIVLDDQTDIGSATTGLRITTAGVISDIDGSDLTISDNLVVTGTGTFTGSSVNVGVDDTTAGNLRLYGGGTGSSEGGEIAIYSAADYDGTVDSWRLDAYQDDFRIFQSPGAGVALSIDGATNNLTITNDLALNGGDITSNQTTFNLLQSTVTTLNVGGAVGAGGINLAGGSGSTGCTIDGSNGNLTCSGTIQGSTAYLAKNSNDTSSASYAGNLYSFTNTNTGAAGVLSLQNSGTNAALQVTQTGNTSASSSTGGAINLNNTSNTGAGLVIYSNQDSTASGALLSVRADNAGFDQSAIYTSYDGTVNAVNIVNTGTGTGNGALNLSSSNTAESTLKVSGTETGRGTVKITHTGTGSDGNASAISIDLQGSGTAAQGIFIDSTGGGTTGNLLNIRNNGSNRLVLDATGNQTLANGNIIVNSNDSNGGAALGYGATGTELKLNGSGNHHWSLLNNAGTLQIGTSDAGVALGQTVTSVLSLSTTGGTFAGDLAVNGGDITSSAGTLIINAAGNVDIQDAVNVDSLDVDTTLTVTGNATFSGSVFSPSASGYSLAINSTDWIQLNRRFNGTGNLGSPDRIMVEVTGGAYYGSGTTQYFVEFRDGITIKKQEFNGGADTTYHTLKIYEEDALADTSTTKHIVGIATGNGSNYHALNITARELVDGEWIDITSTPSEPSTGYTDVTPSITFGAFETGQTTFINSSNSASAVVVQNADSSETLLSIDTTARSGSGGNLIKIGNSTGTDTATTILQLDSATAVPTSNLSALNGGMFYNSTTGRVNVIEGGVVKVLCNQTDASCGGNSTTLQQSYDADSDGSDTIITLSSADDGLIIRNPASSGSDSTYNLTIDQLSTGAKGGLDIQSAGTGNLLRVRDTTSTAQDVLTIADGGVTTFRSQTDDADAFSIQDASGTSLFTVDTTNGKIKLTADVLPTSSPSISAISQQQGDINTNGNSGDATDIAIGTDGYPIVVNTMIDGGTAKGFYATKCTSEDCSTKGSPILVEGGSYGSGVVNTASVTNVGIGPSVAVPSDGYPVISYYGDITGTNYLYVIKCTATDCSTANAAVQVGTAGITAGTAAATSMIIGSDGIPATAYTYSGPKLGVARCTTIDCSSVSGVDTGISSYTQHVSMTVGSNGYPIISSRSSVNGRAVTACANYACSSTTASTQVDSSATNTQNVISPRHIALGSDGYPVLVYTNGSSTVYVKHCTNSTCTSSDTTTTVESGMSGASQASVAIMPNGYPLIAYRSGSTSVLKTKACANVACSSFGTATTVDSSTSQPGRNVAMVFGNDGLPIIVSKANTNNYVRWTHCAVADCSSTSGASTGSSGYNLGSVTNYFNNVYAYKYYGKSLSIGSFDVAEEYKVEDQSIVAGEILSINPGTGKLKRATGNDRNYIFGIVSTEPGLALKDYEANHQDTRLVALVGRVPLKTTGTINIGDPITIDPNNPGKGIKATTPGLIVGRAMESTQNGGTIEVFVQTQYYSPTEEIQGTTYTMMTNLNVSGELRANKLTVSGNAAFDGDVTFGGHIITAGDAPDIEIATNIDLGSGTVDPVATIEGNDASGTLVVDTTDITSPIMPGDLIKITFKNEYDQIPKVFIEASNLNAVGANIYRSVEVDSFTLKLLKPLDPGKKYKLDYLIVQ